ncbi:hypothetical protein DICVIV_05836 [Dictyocaulus viviparus]|uniref:Uncharacterized protein n=1 Tax=Dictyocaulus viviparus TaxID=29172 RepID=A0A0D8XTX3_DICVI|nr:hypothetical protein DICVIV_05836 [Dictyocaulus viviparus]
MMTTSDRNIIVFQMKSVRTGRPPGYVFFTKKKRKSDRMILLKALDCEEQQMIGFNSVVQSAATSIHVLTGLNFQSLQSYGSHKSIAQTDHSIGTPTLHQRFTDDRKCFSSRLLMFIAGISMLGASSSEDDDDDFVNGEAPELSYAVSKRPIFGQLSPRSASPAPSDSVSQTNSLKRNNSSSTYRRKDSCHSQTPARSKITPYSDEVYLVYDN